jgi:hypothetical protein
MVSFIPVMTKQPLYRDETPNPNFSMAKRETDR